MNKKKINKTTRLQYFVSVLQQILKPRLRSRREISVQFQAPTSKHSLPLTMPVNRASPIAFSTRGLSLPPQ